MDFTMSAAQVQWRDRVIAFMTEHVHPAEASRKAGGDASWIDLSMFQDLEAWS